MQVGTNRLVFSVTDVHFFRLFAAGCLLHFENNILSTKCAVNERKRDYNIQQFCQWL